MHKDHLNIDDYYQRERSKDFVKSIAEEFDEDQFSTLVVGRRDDGTHWVIDGQARLLAAEKLKDIQMLPCDVRPSKGPEWEANLFVKLNKDVQKVRAKDIWKGLLASKNKEALELQKIFDSNKEVNYIESIGILMDNYETNKGKLTFARLWPMLVELYQKPNFHGWTLRGFLHLEKELYPSKSLVFFADSVLEIGMEAFVNAVKDQIKKTNNSPKECAKAIRELFNEKFPGEGEFPAQL